MSFACRFAIGADGLAYSGVWKLSAKSGSLYCMIRGMGELKSSIHPPSPQFPEGKKHWGFTNESSSEVAEAAKAEGGRHKIDWTGLKLAPGYTLEWRIIFRGSSLRLVPIPVRPKVRLLPIPGSDEQLEVVVILGPSEARTHPRGKDLVTHLVAQGQISESRQVWVLYCIGPAIPTTDQKLSGRGHAASDFAKHTGPMHGMACGVQPDGSLAFWDARVERGQPG